MTLDNIEVKLTLEVEVEFDAATGQLESASPAMTPGELWRYVRERLEDSCADEIQEQINDSLGEQERECDD